MLTKTWGTRAIRKLLADQELNLPNLEGVQPTYYKDRAREHIQNGLVKDAIRCLTKYYILTNSPPDQDHIGN